jgi:hypothetical protein
MLVLTSFLLMGEVVPLPELAKPLHIEVDANQIYITEGATVFIYSLKDFKLVKKFGKRGEGPGEFNERIRFVDAQADHLFFNSTGKVSYFTKDGTFIKEFRTLSPDMRVKQLGENFVGVRMAGEGGTLYISIDLYDGNLKKIKALHRQEMEVQMGGKGTKVFAHLLPFHIVGDKLFIAKGEEFIIEILDKTGNKQYTITYNYRKIKVTDKDKSQVMDFLKTSPDTAPYLEMLKPIIFPEYFPAIRQYFVASGKVYVLTYKKNENKSEIFLFDMTGKFLKRTYVPYAFMTPVDEYPAAIKNGMLYQVIENEETEGWDLHITLID